MTRLTTVLGIIVLFSGVASGAEGNPPLWGGAAMQDWANASQATVVSDMTRCTPASALSPKVKRGLWKTIPYEIKDGFSGAMIWAGPETGAAEVALPLGVQGWYAIFVGLFSASEAPTRAWLRLDGDPAPVPRGNSATDYYGNVEEVFFKVAELNPNSALLISQQPSGFTCGCGVSHVRLIPLTPEEVTRVRAERADPSHRTMAATCDGFSFIYYRRPTSVQELLSEVEIYRDTDFGTLYLHSPGADKVNYPSAIGHLKGTDVDDFPRVGDRYFVEAIQELARKNINPMKVLIDGAHNVGMKVHVGIRPAGWSFFEPFPDFWESPFFKQNPQWRCVDRDGTPVARMSWAVPEVRKHLVDLLAEMVGFSADGAHLVFNRGYPLVLYEPAFVELFKAQHSVDPRTLDESDPRIRQAWSDVVTTFFRELRAMLDGEAKRRGDGKRLAISACVLGNEADNLQYGLDVRRLINEGLLDEIMVYAWGFGNTHSSDYDLNFFREVCAPKKIPFRPSLAVHWPDFKEQVKQAVSFADAGAAGVAVWDAGADDVYKWSVMARFGHVEETRLRLQNLPSAALPHQYRSFHVLGNQIRDGRFPPYWGG